MSTWRPSVEAILVEARALRTCGVVRGGTSDAIVLADAALELGLGANAATYHPIDADAARDLISAVLRLDLAYRTQAMEPASAHRLAERFVEMVGRHATFFTNGLDPSKPDPQSWSPATLATFDTGVLAVTPTGSACLWVEDED